MNEEIARIWSEENKYRRWLDVELAITETWAARGRVPQDSLDRIRRKAAFDVNRIHELEKKVKHDVIAFLTSLEESLGEDSAYLHMGVTSYDIVDTALALLLAESSAHLQAGLARLRREILKKALAYRDLPAIGRTHGVHAEPVSFGCRFLLWYEELGRAATRLAAAAAEVKVGKLSGAVGSYSQFPPEAESEVLRRLGLDQARVTTQVLQRDRHAALLAALAILGSSLEKIALEIRHLQRTEVLEAEEPFTAGQKGSSAMPHKRNPVRCERISGLARLLRGYLPPVLENNLLWHERDISHSSAERVIFPDAFHLAVFMVDELSDIMAGLIVHERNVTRNLNLTGGLHHSQAVLSLLLGRGLPRQTAYELVQACAMASWSGRGSFLDLLKKDEKIGALLPAAEIEQVFAAAGPPPATAEIYRRFAADFAALQDQDQS